MNKKIIKAVKLINETLITEKKASKLSTVSSYRTLGRLIAKGKIPVYRFESTVLIDPEDLKNLRK